VLDYLYPGGTEVVPPADVHLRLPLRVGVAFAPDDDPVERKTTSNFWTGEYGGYEVVFDESQKQRLLQRVVDAFEGTAGVQSIQVVPASYLKPGGGFENVDQIRSLLGIDLIAVLSYEQTQLQDVNKASLAYWTVVGAYFVEGNENETHTFVDTSVFDIPSRALLFNAGGRSKVEGEATALEANARLRDDSAKGFDRAVTDMIQQLQVSLAGFREQAKSGTVHGLGTPRLAVSNDGEGGGAGPGAAGTCGWIELALALALVAGARLRRHAAA
jgi:rhombotail lipoprotein